MLDNQPENPIMKNRCVCRRTTINGSGGGGGGEDTQSRTVFPTTLHIKQEKKKPSNSNSFSLPLRTIFMFSIGNAFGWTDGWMAGWIFVVKYNLLFHRVMSISIALRRRRRRRRWWLYVLHTHSHTHICTLTRVTNDYFGCTLNFRIWTSNYFKICFQYKCHYLCFHFKRFFQRCTIQNGYVMSFSSPSSSSPSSSSFCLQKWTNINF